MERSARLRKAVRRRISDCGDMPIRIRTSTLLALLRECGLRWEVFNEQQYREVDAIALEAIVMMADS